MEGRMKNIDIAIRSRTNLSMFEAIIGLCESGGFYSGVSSDKAIKKIIDIAKKEQQYLVRMHNEALLVLQLREQP